jgi:hypothetical protein
MTVFNPTHFTISFYCSCNARIQAEVNTPEDDTWGQGDIQCPNCLRTHRVLAYTHDGEHSNFIDLKIEEVDKTSSITTSS